MKKTPSPTKAKTEKAKVAVKLKDLLSKKDPKGGRTGIWENHNETFVRDGSC